jgi:hypothetical protein
LSQKYRFRDQNNGFARYQCVFLDIHGQMHLI